jgi:hypothetical protein
MYIYIHMYVYIYIIYIYIYIYIYICRDVDVATEEIFMKDKEMQFTYGDDTQLFNIIR